MPEPHDDKPVVAFIDDDFIDQSSIEIVSQQPQALDLSRDDSIVIGQRFLILGMLGYVGFGLLAIFGGTIYQELVRNYRWDLPESMATLPWIVLAFLSILVAGFGIYKVCNDGHSTTTKFVFALLFLFLSIIPVFPLLIILIVNQIAYGHLVRRGYRMGLFGAKAQRSG